MHAATSRVPARRLTRFARIAAVAALLVIALAMAGCSTSASADGAVAAPEARIGVDALMLDPGAYTGLIAVTGVVVDVTPEASGLTLIDVDEYEMCGLNPCAGAGMLPLFVPFDGEPSFSGDFYDGEYPELAETVVAVGTVRSGDVGLYFDVERVTRGADTILEKR